MFTRFRGEGGDDEVLDVRIFGSQGNQIMMVAVREGHLLKSNVTTFLISRVVVVVFFGGKRKEKIL